AVLGSEEGASSRLNLSQAFNSLGTAIAPAVGALFILSDTVKSKEEIAALTDSTKEAYYASEAAAVQKPFLGLAMFIALITVIFFFAKLPKIMGEKAAGTYGEALKNKQLMLGVFGIFFYVGAEVAIGSYLVSYFKDMNIIPLIRESSGMMDFANFIAQLFNKSLVGADDNAVLGIFVICYWSGAMIGRFVGSVLTSIIQPAKVLMLFALLAISAIVLSMTTSGLTAMWSILAVGLFNSIMFPTIFTTAIDGLGVLKPKASGLLCTAIVGGAIIPPLYGLFTDVAGFKTALLLVIACYGYILFYGWTKKNTGLATT
ncbi:MAG: glucose/galactose MFS transporter, partial [Bacteroidota bacterium]